MFFVIIVILVIGWSVGFFALKIAAELIHILLVVEVIAIIISFFKGGKSAKG